MNNPLKGKLDAKMMQHFEENVDEEQLEQMVRQVIQEKVVPALVEIRQQRQQAEDPETIRETYANLPEEKQQEVFDSAVMDVVEVVFTLREEPVEGLRMAKQLTRDPHTMEALLLIFDNEQHIDPEYSRQIKDTASRIVTWVGVALFSEMYEPETVESVARDLGLDVDRRG